MDVKLVNESALEAMTQHRWPGNVRELSHTVQRAVLLSENSTLTEKDFQFAARSAGSANTTLNLLDNERELISAAIERFGGNISQAADALGITRAALYRRIEKHRL